MVERGGELAVEVVADKRLNHWTGATCRITSWRTQQELSARQLCAQRKTASRRLL